MLPLLIHFALYPEAKNIIEYLNAKLIKRLKNIQLFKADNIYIIVSGSGYINTCNALSWVHIEEKALIQNAICINMGLAASLNIPLYTWNYAGELIDFETQKKFYPDIVIKQKTNSVISVQKAVTTELTSIYSDKIFDMEAFAFAKSCKFYQPLHHIHVYKFISDKGDLKLEPELVFKHYSESVVNKFIEIKNEFSNLFYSFKLDSNKDVEDIIKNVRNTLKLTVYQTRQIESAIYYYLSFYTVDDLNTLLKLPKFKHKSEKNIFFQNLLHQLYAF